MEKNVFIFVHIFRFLEVLIIHAKLLGLSCLVLFHSCRLIYFSVRFWIKMYILLQKTSKSFWDKIQSRIKRQTATLSCHTENELDRKFFLGTRKKQFLWANNIKNYFQLRRRSFLTKKKKLQSRKKSSVVFNFSTLATP